MTERLVDRCSTCGEEIYEGDTAWKGPDGELYCDEWCVARALASEVTADAHGHMPMSGAMTWTYEEAVRLARAYERLARAARDLIGLWRGVAQAMRDDHLGMTTVYQLCAERLEQALEEASPARWGTGAGDTCNAHRAEA